MGPRGNNGQSSLVLRVLKVLSKKISIGWNSDDDSRSRSGILSIYCNGSTAELLELIEHSLGITGLI